MTTVTVQSPRTVATPRGAALVAWLFQTLGQAAENLTRRRRERAERRAQEARMGDAASVRRYAISVMQYDARFASDLFAAADRHEQLAETKAV